MAMPGDVPASDDGGDVVVTRSAHDAAVLTLTGDLDVDTIHAVREAIGQVLEHPPRVLVLDLGAVGFLDSAGISTLVATRTLATGFGADLRLATVDERVRLPLEATGVWHLFDPHPTVADALAADS